MSHDAAPGDPFRVGRFGTKHGGRNLNDEAAQWPTPAAGNPNDGEPFEHWSARAETLKAKGINGNGAGMPLGIAIKTPWPIPRNNTGASVDAKHLSVDGAVLAWPTPRAEDSQCAGGHRGTDDTLYGAICRPKEGKAWATPTENGNNNQVWMSEKSGDGLGTQVKAIQQNWPTPTAINDTGGAAMCKWGGAGARASMHAHLPSKEINGSLNPNWVEILMCWPIGWTDPVNPCPGIWLGWPMGMGPEQHDYEPPRIAPKGSVPGRVARLKACGNGVVPLQAKTAFLILLTP